MIQKDWVGNKKSIYVTLGASSHTEEERENHDYYATEPKALELLLDLERFCPYVWECACGEGHLAKELEKHGYSVKSTDIADRGFGAVRDFLATEEHWHGDILKNPPFMYAADFVEPALCCIEEGHLAVFFLKVQFLETEKRAELFKRCGLQYLIVNSERVCCAKNGTYNTYFKHAANGAYRGGTQLYCWFVFQKGYSGEPTIRWV